MIDNLIARIVFLRIHFGKAIGPQEGVHIIILPLVGNKEQRLVAIFSQYGGQSGVARHDGAAHHVAFELGGKAVERSINALVRMIAGRIAIFKTQTLGKEAVKGWRKVRGVAKCAHKLRTHRLHKDDYDVIIARFSLRTHDLRQRRDTGQPTAAQILAHKDKRGVFIHQL